MPFQIFSKFRESSLSLLETISTIRKHPEFIWSYLNFLELFRNSLLSRTVRVSLNFFESFELFGSILNFSEVTLTNVNSLVSKISGTSHEFPCIFRKFVALTFFENYLNYNHNSINLTTPNGNDIEISWNSWTSRKFIQFVRISHIVSKVCKSLSGGAITFLKLYKLPRSLNTWSLSLSGLIKVFWSDFFYTFLKVHWTAQKLLDILDNSSYFSKDPWEFL